MGSEWSDSRSINFSVLCCLSLEKIYHLNNIWFVLTLKMTVLFPREQLLIFSKGNLHC